MLGHVNVEPETLGGNDEKWVDLDDSKTVWLKIYFDQDKPPIIKFGLYHIPFDQENNLVKIAITEGRRRSKFIV